MGGAYDDGSLRSHLERLEERVHRDISRPLRQWLAMLDVNKARGRQGGTGGQPLHKRPITMRVPLLPSIPAPSSVQHAGRGHGNSPPAFSTVLNITVNQASLAAQPPIRPGGGGGQKKAASAHANTLATFSACAGALHRA